MSVVKMLRRLRALLSLFVLSLVANLCAGAGDYPLF